MTEECEHHRYAVRDLAVLEARTQRAGTRARAVSPRSGGGVDLRWPRSLRQGGGAVPDVYAAIADVDVATQERLAEILELRAADRQQRAMLESYLSEIEFPPGARVLEIGCGTGPVTRVLARQPDVAEAVGVDPSPVFISTARELAGPAAGATFEQGDGRSLKFADGDFDAAILHTTLCHIPQPERVLAEAFRVLRSDGTLAVFDGDYTTITVAVGNCDPLQDCIEAVKAVFINDVWLVRRLPTLLRSAGFELVSSRGHSYLQTSDPEYMLTLVDRGADTLASWGRIGPDLCASLKAEAQRRAETEAFYGFIGFVSVIARKPARRH
jgi:ubiquinone/menaquinone biosynthesis C-methylase UbiE